MFCIICAEILLKCRSDLCSFSSKELQGHVEVYTVALDVLLAQEIHMHIKEGTDVPLCFSGRATPLQTTKTKMSGKGTPTEKGEKVKYYSLNIIFKLEVFFIFNMKPVMEH